MNRPHPSKQPRPNKSEFDRRWATTADKVAEFRAESGRWPSMSATSADERRLGAWLNNQRGKAKGVSTSAAPMTPERRTYLDAVAPGWGDPRGIEQVMATRDAKWERTADHVATFYRDNNQWPSRFSPEVEERRLGGWLKNQRVKAQPGSRDSAQLTERRRAYLDSVAPGWCDNTDATWIAIGEEFRAFVAENGCVPSEGENERLCTWYRNVRHQVSGSGGTDRRAWLDLNVPGWETLPTRSELERVQRAEELVSWVRQNGRMPSAWADADHERALGFFRANVARAVRAGKRPLAADILDRELPDWADRGHQWTPFEEWADAAAAFVSGYGRLPTSADGRVGAWLDRQRRANARGDQRLTSERKALLDRRLPRWNEPGVTARPQVAQSLAGELIRFHQEHGRWPKWSRDDPAERRLSNALYHRRKRSDRESYRAEAAALDAYGHGWRGQSSK